MSASPSPEQTKESRAAEARVRAPLAVKLMWVSAVSLASGFPYGFVNLLLPVYLREAQASRELIGQLLAWASLAWTLKFAWSFLVDRFGTRKAWIVCAQLGICLATLALVAVDPTGAPVYLTVVVVALAALSATQDIAINAYIIQLLDERELGPGNGAQVTAYRIAMLFAGGALVQLFRSRGWPTVFVAGAAAMALLMAVTLTVPSLPKLAGATSLREVIEEPLRDLMRLPAFWALILFELTFKLGDLALTPMTGPFWVDQKFSATEIALMIGQVGMLATIAGAIAGGALTARLGTFRALWTLGLAQALSNLGYYYVAAHGAPTRALAYGAVIVEQFTSGLGTAAFLAFNMSICEKRYAATQFALLTGTWALSRTFVTWFSGTWAERLGYANYFLLTFLFAFPAFALLPWVRRLKRYQLSEDERRAATA